MTAFRHEKKGADETAMHNMRLRTFPLRDFLSQPVTGHGMPWAGIDI